MGICVAEALNEQNICTPVPRVDLLDVVTYMCIVSAYNVKLEEAFDGTDFEGIYHPIYNPLSDPAKSHFSKRHMTTYPCYMVQLSLSC